MEIQPIVVGTAGHIDHGKSTLVKVLTGIDPDRLKEEQERGMTIDLGFARFTLPDGRRVGMVDVPGHERFVKNMVAGATGIDLVVLVVAADDGVMPQTREHLAIMQILGVARGMIALTKIDKVEPALAELASEDVRAAVRRTFLESAPFVPLSAHTGEGMPEFRRELFRLAGEAAPRSDAGVFRMPVQRVFSAKGFGTVLTGIPVSGAAALGDVLEVLPGERRGKVRGIQAYQEAATRARAGHSAAINLTDVGIDEVARGHVLASPGFFRPTRMVAARFTALPGLERALEDRLPIRLHTGTLEALGELVLLDCERVEPGASALVQVRLEQPVVCAPGDRYVLRLASPAVTLGGGVLLEESKHRLKRFKPFVLAELTRAADGLGSPRELLEVVLARRAPGLASPAELSVAIKRAQPETEALLGELARAGSARLLGTRGWIHTERLSAARAQVAAELARWFEANPHRSLADVRDLRRATGYEPAFLDALLELEAHERTLALEPGGFVRALGRAANADPATEEAAARVRAALDEARFQPPSPSELGPALGLAEKRLKAVLELLVDRGELTRVTPELYLARAHFEAARAAVVENCQRNGSLDIPSLRDRLATSRKFLIPLLEHLDASGVTLRQGNNRVLRKR
jgi:selenocysteine-specific elongation factor